MPPSRRPALPVRDLIDIQLEEYRALYGLASHRLSSLERRTPIVGAVLSGSVASLTVVPSALQSVILLGAPILLVWFVKSTINHAKSLEDVLRRIDAIECEVNERAGGQLLRFQSTHPSRGSAVGGRVSAGTIRSVVSVSLLLLYICAALLPDELPGTEAFYTYVAIISGWIAVEAFRLRRYAYFPSTPDRGTYAKGE